MSQVENLKIIHENVRNYFEEMTFTRQGRITEKAFKFLTLYTFTVAVIPTYVKTVLDFSQFVATFAAGIVWIVGISIVSLLSLGLFVIAVVLMLRVVHVQYHSAFDFSGPLEEVWNNPELPEEVLLYSISKKLIEASNENFPVDDRRSERMKRSYTLFYVAVGAGLITFIGLRLFLYFNHV